MYALANIGIGMDIYSRKPTRTDSTYTFSVNFIIILYTHSQKPETRLLEWKINSIKEAQ